MPDEVIERAREVAGSKLPTAVPREPRGTRAERYAKGKQLRQKWPRSSHAVWTPPANRVDPLSLVEETDKGRIPELVPIRHGRMLQSPFTFYRGAALNMASDLAATPSTHIQVQTCGDAHLVNFRGLSTPERRIVFDIHDLDETLCAPWEWDLKRLATSFVLACRDNSLGKNRAEDAALTCARSYRAHMLEYSKMTVLEVWYDRLEAEKLVADIKDSDIRKRVKQRVAEESARTAFEYDFPKLAYRAGRRAIIKDSPPTIFHPSEDSVNVQAIVQGTFAAYRETLSDDRRFVLDHFEIKDIATKVVGVGSVGTRCWVVLLAAGKRDPLFLQVKEARESVLEAYAGKSPYANHGQRVVAGHRLMQSASDIFLGWTRSPRGVHYYLRQLRDVKIKPDFETFGAGEMIVFADWCGHSLARSHARSGDAAMISGYLGTSDKFDQAIAAFSAAYADQTERDHNVLAKAARNRRIAVEHA